MNSDKLLVKMEKVPMHVSMEELWIEIAKLMKYSYSAAKDLAGLYIEDINPRLKFLTVYIYFMRMASIKKLERLCHQETNEFFLYILNSKIKVNLPKRETWNLSIMQNLNDQQSKKEIRIRTSRHEAIGDVLRNLHHKLSRPEEFHPIESCIQAKEFTYVKFSTEDLALRAKEDFERNHYNVEFSRTYLCLCVECEDEEEERLNEIQNRDNQEPIPSTSAQVNDKTLSLTLSDRPIKKDINIIQIGKIPLRKLIGKFKINDTINFQLTPTTATTSTSNDPDVLTLNEDIELSDA